MKKFLKLGKIPNIFLPTPVEYFKGRPQKITLIRGIFYFIFPPPFLLCIKQSWKFVLIPTYLLGQCPAFYYFSEVFPKKMSTKGVFLDHEVMHIIACHLMHDIVVIPVHPITAANGMFTYIHGGSVWTDQRVENCPIFLGNYKYRHRKAS